MKKEEYLARLKKAQKNSQAIQNNCQKVEQELERVEQFRQDTISGKVFDDLENLFEQKTGLQGRDIGFLFAAIGLQMLRIYIINEVTRIRKAGHKNPVENKLHEYQQKLFDKFDVDDDTVDGPYHASLAHILTTPGVPYDATAGFNEERRQRMEKKGKQWQDQAEDLQNEEKLNLFKGANHRFSTLGHEPILGLLFGTANIMTNTISCYGQSGLIQLPVIATHHVVYTNSFSDPSIGIEGSTLEMFSHICQRTEKQPQALVAALLKQIIHIGTDLYTPCGIQIPGASLVLDKKQVELLTSYISTGDLIKAGVAAKLAELINLFITILHGLTYDEKEGISRELFSVRTRKVVTISNIIASSSSILWAGVQAHMGNEFAFKEIDYGGLLVALKRLYSDRDFIRQLKEEFVMSNYEAELKGKPIVLEKMDF